MKKTITERLMIATIVLSLIGSAEVYAAEMNNERSRKLDEKLRKFRLYQNIRDAIGGRYYRK